MAHSIQSLTLTEEILDVLDFLIDNHKVIISDLKKEFKLRLEKGRNIHKGFKLQLFEQATSDAIQRRIKEMFSNEKQYYLSSETVMLIESDPLVKHRINKIIKEVLNE